MPPSSYQHRKKKNSNYGKCPDSLTLLNLDIINTAEDYVPPEITKKFSRVGVLRALFRDEDSGVFIPVEIHFTFDVRGRGNNPGIYIILIAWSTVI